MAKYIDNNKPQDLCNLSSFKPTDPIDKEIRETRLYIGEIEVKMAELEKRREAAKKKLSKLLKKKMLESLNNHVLIGSEARKLSEIIDIVFPFHKLDKEYGERELMVSHNNINISQIVEDKEFKVKPFTASPLWDLAKLL